MITFITLIALYGVMYLFFRYFPVVMCILSGDKRGLYDCDVPCAENKDPGKLPICNWKGEPLKFLERDFKE